MSTLSSLVLTSSSTLTLDLIKGNVVKDMSELLLVHPAEGLADFLCERIGNAVGVTDSLPLDDLDFLHGGGNLVESLHIDVL